MERVGRKYSNGINKARVWEEILSISRLRLNIEGKTRDLVETALKKITGIIQDTK